MEENKPGRSRTLIIGCGSLLAIILICAACAAIGYYFRPVDSTELAEFTERSGLNEITIRGTNVAQVVGLVEPTSTPDLTDAAQQLETSQPETTPEATATPRPTPTNTATVRGSPTLPPTDTPRPKPTATPTNTPSLSSVMTSTVMTSTLEPDAASTEVARAIDDVLFAEEEILSGSINLVTIDNNFVFPPAAWEAEFTWTWSGGSGCDPPPDGYGFDVRIWPDRPDFGPLGVDEVATIQEEIFCIPESGKRGYLLGFLSGTPAVKAQGAGSFLWDVAFVKMNPYTPLYTSPPRRFEISLKYPDPGPLDPKGKNIGGCGKFGIWAEAQAFFIAADGPAEDRHGLDPDRNGIACDAIAPDLLK
jgi:hypothetical protein